MKWQQQVFPSYYLGNNDLTMNKNVLKELKRCFKTTTVTKVISITSMLYISTAEVNCNERKEGNVLFNNAFITF